ncbi:hypothetical protein BM28_B0885 [Brucella melitensis M28]|nr:hypothetical protein BM28_B0885 [Brucella melitensis M28]
MLAGHGGQALCLQDEEMSKGKKPVLSANVPARQADGVR